MFEICIIVPIIKFDTINYTFSFLNLFYPLQF